MKEQNKSGQVYGYITGRIRQLDENTPWAKAMLAKLRRAAGKTPGESPEVWEVTLGGMPDELSGGNHDVSYAEQAVYTALTLYALHRQGGNASMHEGKGLSLGGGAARLRNEKTESGIQRRFDAVITAKDLTELSYHARGLIQLMRASNTSNTPVRLDYAQLAVDLFRYQFPEQRSTIHLKWGRDFYKNKIVEVNNKDE